MFFLALQAVRIPAFRDLITSVLQQVHKKVLRVIGSTAERFEMTVKKMKDDGIDIGKTTYEEVRRFIEDDAFDMEYPSDLFVQQLLVLFRDLFPYLADRNWSLRCAGETSGDFVCSDRPVGLSWAPGLETLAPPGFGMQGTIVSLPLSRKIALEGRFEGTSRVSTADARLVALINGQTVLAAEQCVYSPSDDFVWARPGSALQHSVEFLEMFADAR